MTRTRAVLLFVLLAGCGAPANGADEASQDPIVGGGKSTAWPSVGYLNAVIQNTKTNETGLSAPFCTGTLIAPKAVLTAAHCLEGMAELTAAFEKNKSVRLLGFAFGTGAWQDGHIAPIVSARKHPKFEKPALNGPLSPDTQHDYEHDIAYVVLDKAFPDVTPAQVVIGEHPASCDYVSIGYGVSTPGYVEGAPGQADPNSGQRKSVATCAKAGYASGMIMTEAPKGSTCNGDSGGPLHARNDDAIYGVLSSGQSPCDPREFSLYTPIAKNVDFVGEALAAGK